MGKYPTTNIVYSGMEDKGGPTVTILDEKKNKWTIWKADYENKELDSEAYGSLKAYKIGESFGVEYGEKEESFVAKEGKTINFTRRTIYKILPLVSNPSASQAQPASPSRSKTGPSMTEYESREAFGKRLAIHGMVNGMLAAGATIETIVKDLPALLKLESKIDLALNERPMTAEEAMEDALPVIQQGEDVDVEDIPF
jgi:hypothetical protein